MARDGLLKVSESLWRLDDEIDEGIRLPLDSARAEAVAAMNMCDLRDTRRELPWIEYSDRLVPFDDAAVSTTGIQPIAQLADPVVMPRNARNALCASICRETQHIRRQKSVWDWFDQEVLAVEVNLDELL
jgi:hypothetical protein